MNATPTGEPLPDYPDDDRAPTPATLLQWLRANTPELWSLPRGFDLDEANQAIVDHSNLQRVASVLQALQAAGDAQLVKNGTYRALRRNETELEALAAFLINNGYADKVLECDGHAADAAIQVITGYARAARQDRGDGRPYDGPAGTTS